MKTQIFIVTYQSPVGLLMLGAFDDKLCLCDWVNSRKRLANDKRLTRLLKADYHEKPSFITDQACQELTEYFNGSRREFTLPLLLAGTDFQKTLWQALMEIGHGKTMSYSSLAKTIGKPTATRAVASAVGANPLSIFIPCHRIIGIKGQLKGYAGGLEAKKRLLELEGL
ncbi:MAG: methylated-DNA--[protein]-cysteine S-methyltransferase [Spirochaetales bacterium]|nr:methylated-DNA--[protein]-cysteine S-methyltransferase [Spirochaetales bacterium]